MEKAALDLANAAMSPIIEKLGIIAASYFGGDITREELRHLQTIILPKIRTVIKAAEKIDAATLRPWLMELQAATYEAEDILDMYEYNKIKNEVSPLPASFKKIKGKAKELFAPLLLKTEMRKSLEKLQESANEADKLINLLGLANATTQVDNPTMISQRRPTVSSLLSPVFGRNKERDDLVNALIVVPHESSSNKQNVVIHAIHGIGGAGKTTLAQYVYNDGRVGNYFGLKIWIHVSRTFDITRITGEIIQSIEKSDSPPVGNLDSLHTRLKEVLESKRFLLVLDDIWIEDKYLCDQLLIPLIEGGEAGSGILITTHQEVTAQSLRVKDENIIHLTELKTEECWSILKYYAFGDADKEIKDPLLAYVGREILCKLKNSPLVARLVGCLLSKKVCVDAWKRILNSDMLGETLDVILLSFQHLPSQLQRCFAICSLYRKGYMYDSTKSSFLYNFSEVDRLIQFWIAQGYVEATGNESLEDKGMQYFDDLVSYSLFQRDSAFPSRYVMHDLVHDATEKVSKDYCFRIAGDDPLSIPATTIHLSVVRGKLHMHMPNILKLVNLRTFVIFPSFEVEFNNPIEHTAEMFKKLTKLRVLRFGWCWVPEVNNSVGKLRHLRNLQLRGGKKLSESLGTLYHLQFVELECIAKVPNRLNKLRKVRCSYSKIEDFEKLNFLEKLKIYSVIKCGGLQQLGNLQGISGALIVEGLEKVEDKAEAATAKLNAKSQLERLELKWNTDREAVVDDILLHSHEDVLEGLAPNLTLQWLKIKGCIGAKPPNWFRRLHNLLSLELENCPNLVGILSNEDRFPGRLKELRIHNCPQLTQLPERAISSSPLSSSYEVPRTNINNFRHRPLSSLESLEIRDCYGLDEKALNGFLQLRFSSLSSLTLLNLPLIACLCLGPHLTTLKDLDINGLENLSSIQDMRSVRSVKKLKVHKCPMLRRIGGGGENITDCRFSSVKKILIDEPLMLPVLLHQQGLNSLKELSIEDCSQDVGFSTEQEDVFLHLTYLRRLYFKNCEKFPSLPATLDTLSSLETLSIICCRMLESLPNLPSHLEKLEILGCDKIESLPNLPSSLEILKIDECRKIESLPNLPSSLKLLSMWDNPHLKENYAKGGPLRPQIHHIPHISIYP